MMNEFFPKFYQEFFRKKIGDKVQSMLITEFLESYGERLERIELKVLGASWVDGHVAWIEGSRRERINRMLQELSKKFHSLPKVDNETKKLFLVAETSCYNYWGTEFWFEQGERTIAAALERINKLML
jgi:hypothetical protein